MRRLLPRRKQIEAWLWSRSWTTQETSSGIFWTALAHGDRHRHLVGLAEATARCGASRPLSAQVSRPSQRGFGDAPVIAAARTLTEPRMELCKSPECNLKAWPAGPLAASLGCPSQLQTTTDPSQLPLSLTPTQHPDTHSDGCPAEVSFAIKSFRLHFQPIPG